MKRATASTTDRRPWADLVFHVLSHAAQTARLPASVHDAVYVEFAARHLGPAGNRSLAEDAAVLGRVLGAHELLARAQLVARLFTSTEAASASAAIDLTELARAGVVRAELVRALQPIMNAAELLRAASELECGEFMKLPPPSFDGSELAAALHEASSMAPELDRCRVAAVRSLRLRGRAFPGEIWIGVPGTELEVSLDHVVWQACHEATVLELRAAAGENMGERALEHAAVVLLAERAQAAGKAREHGRWLAHFGEAPPIDGFDPVRFPGYSAPAASAGRWRSRT